MANGLCNIFYTWPMAFGTCLHKWPMAFDTDLNGQWPLFHAGSMCFFFQAIYVGPWVQPSWLGLLAEVAAQWKHPGQKHKLRQNAGWP